MKENTEPRLLRAKCCYGHLGGVLGDRLFGRMVELGWFEATSQPKEYMLTPAGIEHLSSLGVDFYERGKN